jgi:hypothetical protein
VQHLDRKSILVSSAQDPHLQKLLSDLHRTQGRVRETLIGFMPAYHLEETFLHLRLPSLIGQYLAPN